jgi:hypothetical protein
MIECRVIKQLSVVIDLNFTDIAPKMWVSIQASFDRKMSGKNVLTLECPKKVF